MKVRIWSKDHMQQIINSGNKEFDKQTVCISSGQAIGATQTSSIIRSIIAGKCENDRFRSLQQDDLKWFRHLQPGSNLYHTICSIADQYGCNGEPGESVILH